MLEKLTIAPSGWQEDCAGLRLLVNLGKHLELIVPILRAEGGASSIPRYHLVPRDFFVKTGERLGFTPRLTRGHTEAAHMCAEQKPRDDERKSIWEFSETFKAVSLPGLAPGAREG